MITILKLMFSVCIAILGTLFSVPFWNNGMFPPIIYSVPFQIAAIGAEIICVLGIVVIWIDKD